LLLGMNRSSSSLLDSAHKKGHFSSSSLSLSFLGVCLWSLAWNLRSSCRIFSGVRSSISWGGWTHMYLENVLSTAVRCVTLLGSSSKSTFFTHN
jgi:hypothetical protein